MGCFQSSSINPYESDVIDSLEESTRLEYLLYGFIRSIQFKIKSYIPNEIYLICKQYVNDIEINSNKEIALHNEWIKFNKTGKHEICLLGAGAVGKTAIIHRLLYNEYLAKNNATIKDIFKAALYIYIYM